MRLRQFATGERTSRTDGDRVVEFVRSVYRGDRYRIVVDIFPS